MKFNLKNRPKFKEEYHCKSWAYNDVNYWFEGFEAELREKLAMAKGWGFDDYIKIKEILGE